MHKKFLRTLMICFLSIFSSAPLIAMDDGELDYKRAKSHAPLSSARANTNMTKKVAELYLSALEAGAKKGHPLCQKELSEAYDNVWGYYTTQASDKSSHWSKVWRENPSNPEYVARQLKLKQEKEEQELKKVTEPLRLQLELEKAQIRRMELELQLAQAKNQPQLNYQQQPVRNNTNNIERNIRVADGMINMTNDGVNLLSNLQGSGFF